MLPQRGQLSGVPVVVGKHKVPAVLKLSRAGNRRLVSQLKSHLEGVMERSLGEYVGWGDEEGGGNEGREVVCQGNTEL